MLAWTIVASGCELLPSPWEQAGMRRATDSAIVAKENVEPPAPAAVAPAVASPAPPAGRPSNEVYLAGSGKFVGPARRRADVSAAPGAITLNFENTPIVEVIKVILDDQLEENYSVDPAVSGTVTLQTSRPLARSALLPTLEMLLRSNGAALVRSDGQYHVVPQEKAIRGLLSPQLGGTADPLPKGYSVRVVPLRFIAATEMYKILEPFSTPGNIVRVDKVRNLLILAGAGPELGHLLDTIAVFDVDWVAGMSVGLFTPDFVEAKVLVDELNKVFQDTKQGPLAGVVRIVDIERLNAVLVLSPRKEYLDKVADWIDRLDRDTGNVGQRLYVYPVQNGRAVDLADVLNQVFEGREPRRRVPRATVAPGLKPVEVMSPKRPATPTQPVARQIKPAARAARDAARPAAAPAPPVGGADDAVAVSEESSIRIIADETNNALLILATAAEYKQVLGALRRLDIVPLQVLIEVTIAEISLTGELQHGLEWFFKNNLGRYGGVGTLDLGIAGIAALAPGFSYAIADAGGVVRAVLNALASESKVKIVSSPSLMVLNNQTASINVGDEVPVTTQQQQSTVGGSTVINTIEFRKTGVLLTVTPRVNAGGLVIMEVEQEVSDVAPGTGDSLTPTIQQRKIQSTVAVQSGQTVVLGGLIRENASVTSAGIPVLYKLPIIGALFGARTDERRRVELVVLITPRAVQDATEARSITDEFRGKMESLKPLVSGIGR